MTVAKTDLDAIEALVAGLERAWNVADGAGFAARFAEDADFVNIYGMHGKGRQNIADAHDRILHSVYEGSVVSYQMSQVRLIREDVAVVHFRARLRVPQGPLSGEMEALPSMVLTREAGGWTVASFHNTLVKEPPGMHNNGQPQ